MSNETNEVLDLLENIAKEKAFTVPCTDGKTSLKFKKLNTSHLKQIISTLDDSSVSLTAFNSVTTKIMEDCLLNEENKIENCTVLDKLLFLIETRIESVSKTIKYGNKTDKTAIEIDLRKIKEQVYNCIKNNLSSFEEKILTTEDDITINYGIPTIKAEDQLNKEIYQGEEIKIQGDLEKFKDLLSNIILNEITKSIKSLCVKEKILNFSELSFSDRLKIVEKLPLSVVNEIFEYVQTYKNIIEQGLTDTSGNTLKIDGSLFIFN